MGIIYEKEAGGLHNRIDCMQLDNLRQSLLTLRGVVVASTPVPRWLFWRRQANYTIPLAGQK
jgi:hypothetical protein